MYNPNLFYCENHQYAFVLYFSCHMILLFLEHGVLDKIFRRK